MADEIIRMGFDTGEGNLGVSEKTVGAWERGESVPRPPYPKLLVRVFGVSAQDLGLFRPERGMLGAGDEEGNDVERRAFLQTVFGAASLPILIGDIDGLTLEGFLHQPRRYLSSWSVTPTRDLVSAALACRWMAEGSDSDEAVCEASLLLAWIASDRGEESRMDRHFRDAARAAERAGNRPLLVYTLTSWADLSFRFFSNGEGDEKPSSKAVRLIDQAWSALPADAPADLRNYILSQKAIKHAMVGDAARAMSALDRQTGPHEPTSATMVYPMGEATFARTQGCVARYLGNLDRAIPALERALNLQIKPNKQRVSNLIQLWRAYLQAGHPERASELRSEAQVLGRRLGLRRLTAAG